MCSVGVDTTLTLHHTTRFAATRPFLKWFSTYFSACFRHFWTEIIGRSLIGSLSLAIQEFHGLSDTDLGSVVGDEHRILLLQNLEDVGYGHPSSFFLILGRTEAGFQHAFYIVSPTSFLNSTIPRSRNIRCPTRFSTWWWKAGRWIYRNWRNPLPRWLPWCRERTSGSAYGACWSIWGYSFMG